MPQAVWMGEPERSGRLLRPAYTRVSLSALASVNSRPTASVLCASRYPRVHARGTRKVPEGAAKSPEGATRHLLSHHLRSTKPGLVPLNCFAERLGTADARNFR